MRRTLALSDHWLPRFLRRCRRSVLNFGLPPIPRVVAVPLLTLFLVLRSTYFFTVRVFFCEPFFKAYCTRYGRGVHTGVFFHWIQGRGQLIVGDNVLIDGKCSFTFAARFSEEPTLIIGDNTGISHACILTIGKKVVIGRHCRISSDVWIFDSPGHSNDPEARRAGLPASTDNVRPVIIGDNVWIGRRASIYPGVRIGDNAIIASNSSVFSDVPANAIVGGNPARVMGFVGKQDVSQSESLAPLTDPPYANADDLAPENGELENGELAALLSEIINVIKEVGKVPSLSPDEDFYDAGISSMASLTLMLALEEKYKVPVPDEQFIACRTATQIRSLIADLLSQPEIVG